MSEVQRKVLIGYMVSFLCFLAIFLASLKISYLLILWIPCLFISGSYSWSVRCPKCNVPVLQVGKVGQIPIWGIWPSKCCQKCGFEFGSAKKSYSKD